MPAADQMRAAVAAYFQAISSLDPEAWADTFAEGGRSCDPWGSPPHEGREALVQFLGGLCEAFERVQMELGEVFLAGSGGAVQWRARCVARNGRNIEFSGIDTFEFEEDGRIREARGYWDFPAVMARIQG